MSAPSPPPPPPPPPPPLVADYARLERRVSVALLSSRYWPARQLPSELVRLVVSFLWSPRTSASRQLFNPRQRDLCAASLAICSGWVHADTAQFDDWAGGQLRERVMAGWRLSAIDGYGDRYCNGFQFSYAGPRGDVWRTELRKGSHHRPARSRLQLAAGERVVQVAVRLSKWMECCVFETSQGRRFQVGGRGSRWAPKERHASEWTHAGVTQLLLMPPQPPPPQPAEGEVSSGDAVQCYEALAFAYGVGGHIHNLGCYYQPLWPAQPQPQSATAALSAATRDLSRAPSTASGLGDDEPAASAVLWRGTAWPSQQQQPPHPATARQPLLSS